MGFPAAPMTPAKAAEHIEELARILCWHSGRPLRGLSANERKQYRSNMMSASVKLYNIAEELAVGSNPTDKLGFEVPPGQEPGMREQRIALISDLQTPYHHPAAVSNVLRLLADWQPTFLANVGDDLDCPQVSSFGKGLRDGEYAGTLQRDFDTCKQIHRLFRQAVGDIPYVVSRSNHSDR